MANNKIFSVYDSKAEYWMTPFFQRTTGEALRAWVEGVNDPATAMSRHPNDFTLFEIGTWDETTGQIEMFHAKKELGLATQFKKQPTDELTLLKSNSK